MRRPSRRRDSATRRKRRSGADESAGSTAQHWRWRSRGVGALAAVLSRRYQTDGSQRSATLSRVTRPATSLLQGRHIATCEGGAERHSRKRTDAAGSHYDQHRETIVAPVSRCLRCGTDTRWLCWSRAGTQKGAQTERSQSSTSAVLLGGLASRKPPKQQT